MVNNNMTTNLTLSSCDCWPSTTQIHTSSNLTMRRSMTYTVLQPSHRSHPLTAFSFAHAPPQGCMWCHLRDRRVGSLGGTCRLHLPGQKNQLKKEPERKQPTAFSLVLCWADSFNREDVGEMFLRNIGWLSTGQMVLHPRRKYFYLYLL
jgi:hypothetical protein